MSRKYKFHNKEGLYFVSFATVYWIDVFIRRVYCDILVESLNHCVKEKGLLLYAWCIMPSHVHLIFKSSQNNPQRLLQDFKKYTAKRLMQAVKDNIRESRRKWIIWMMESEGKKRGQQYQFWQQHNKPIELWSVELIKQKLNYIHNNPVVSGFVSEPYYWTYSSAIDYSGGKGLIRLEPI